MIKNYIYIYILFLLYICVCDPKIFARLIPYFFGDQIPSNQMLANNYKFKQ